MTRIVRRRPESRHAAMLGCLSTEFVVQTQACCIYLGNKICPRRLGLYLWLIEPCLVQDIRVYRRDRITAHKHVLNQASLYVMFSISSSVGFVNDPWDKKPSLPPTFANGLPRFEFYFQRLRRISSVFIPVASTKTQDLHWSALKNSRPKWPGIA